MKTSSKCKAGHILFLHYVGVYTVSISREDVAEWANREAELPTGLHSQVAPSSWTHTYIIYLKMFYDVQAKWEDACDSEKLQQLYGHMNK